MTGASGPVHGQWRRRRLRAAALSVALGAAGLAAGCATSAPEVPVGPDGTADEVLVTGRDIYTRRCASCHGASGGGGRGPAFEDGRVVERYPDTGDHIEVVRQGRGAMPAFEDVLDPAEIEAVVRYTREVLAA